MGSTSLLRQPQQQKHMSGSDMPDVQTIYQWRRRRCDRLARLNVFHGQAWRDSAREIRHRARRVGWMLGEATTNKGKVPRLTPLVHGLRTTWWEEDLIIEEALKRQHHYDNKEFEAVQEIVTLRQTMRMLVRTEAEHPNADIRSTAIKVLAKINNSKKKQAVPIPRPLAVGPSFAFTQRTFRLTPTPRTTPQGSQQQQQQQSGLILGPDNESEYGALSSSGSDDDDDNDGDDRGGILYGSVRKPHGLMWARRYADMLVSQWPTGAPHIFQLLAPIPQCGVAALSTFASVIYSQRSSLGEPEAWCLYAAGAAQVGCYSLVHMAEAQALLATNGRTNNNRTTTNSDHSSEDGDGWESICDMCQVYGLEALPAKTQLLAQFGFLFGQKPWQVDRHRVASFVAEYERVFVPHTQSPILTTARRARTEVAVRDLLHAAVIMATARARGAFAAACAVSPDIDSPAGSFFQHIDDKSLMSVKYVPGLPFVEPQPTPQPMPPSLTRPAESFMAKAVSVLPERVESNTAQFVSKLLRPNTIQGGFPPQRSKQRYASQPSRSSSFTNPLASPAPQFVAYRSIRARMLNKYAVDTPSPLLQHDDQQRKQQKLGTAAVHLPQREDLKWDVLRVYLRQRLAFAEDFLGNETLTARGFSGRNILADATIAASASSNQENTGVQLLDLSYAPLKSDNTLHSWERESNDLLLPTDYDASKNIPVSLPGTNSHLQSFQTVYPCGFDVQHFHDAIWHFTLSLCHVYEEYFFYNMYKDEVATPSCSSGGMPVPLRAIGSTVDNDEEEEDVEKRSSGESVGCTWLTEELKEHIRCVVRRPDIITPDMAQPVFAAGLNLSAEEMVHINLIVSLAKRQAEITHLVRAIRAYEEDSRSSGKW